MIELTFLKKLMLIRQGDQKSEIFVTIGIFLGLSFNQMSAMGVMISMNLCNIAILNIYSADYRCIISGISKSEAINVMQKSI